MLRRLLLIGIAMLAAPVVVASAQPQRYELRVATDGNGVVRTTDGAIECGATCAASYRSGAVVRLRAAPKPGLVFARWAGACVGTAPTCILAVDRAKRVRASFEPAPHSVPGVAPAPTSVITLAVGGPGTVVSEPPALACGSTARRCSAAVPVGTTLRLSAAPDADAAFDSWSAPACPDAAAATCELVVTGGMNLSTTFRRGTADAGDQTLTVRPSRVRVRSDVGGIDCPGSCSAVLPAGSRVTLRTGSAVWGGACAGMGPCTLVLDTSLEVSALVVPPTSGVPMPGGPGNRPPLVGLNVSVSGPGIVAGGDADAPIRCGRSQGTQLDCDALFELGDTVELRATPRRYFSRWAGFCQGTAPRCLVRATAAKTVLAVFRR